ncbi:MAG: DUF6252 family protein [Bacteroidota bacterium]|nr:DUF6252 family protein [Bacteroidota bacterium]
MTILSLLFLLILTYSCCKKNDTLPPETQEGKNTFGCLVNNNLWLKGGGLSYPYSNLSIFIDKNFFSINALKIGDQTNQTVNIYIHSPLNVGIYDLNNYNHSGRFLDKIDNCYYKTDSLSATGTLEITKYDTINKIVSGLFNFKALRYNPDNNTIIENNDSSVQITQGRFDIKYRQ